MQFCSIDNCSYPNFGKDKLTGLPYCRNHQTKRTDFDRRSIIQKAMSKQKSLSTKIRSLQNTPANMVLLEEKGIVKHNDLDLFYRLRREEMKGKCSEPGCNGNTNKMSDKYFKWSICHIVPKSTVPSVSTNQFNWIELCWQHHSEMDSTFEKQSKMKCFDEVKRKFELFKNLIPNEELRKVSPYLKNDIIYPIS